MARKKTGYWNVILILLFIGMINSIFDNKNTKQIESSKANVELINKEVISKDKNENKDNSHQKTYIPEKENEFIGDDLINKLLKEYNAISEFKINKDNVKNGAYYSNAITSCNGVWIMIYDSKDIFVDLSIEDWDDSHIYPVFRDFIKTLDCDVLESEIKSGWNDLLTGKYIGYKYRNIGNTKCSGVLNKLSNGINSYAFEIWCNEYGTN